MTETLVHGFSSESTQQELPVNTNMTGYRWFLKIFASLSFGQELIPTNIAVWFCDTFDHNMWIREKFRKIFIANVLIDVSFSNTFPTMALSEGFRQNGINQH